MGEKGSKEITATGIKDNFPDYGRYLKVLDDYVIRVLFWNGLEKEYDFADLIESDKRFSLLKNKELFTKAHFDSDEATAIIWNDEIDIDLSCVYYYGKTVSTAFDNLLSMRDATDSWGLDESTIRKAIQYNRLVVGEDVAKFGKQWVLTRGAVKRIYGESLDERLSLCEDELERIKDINDPMTQRYLKTDEGRKQLADIEKALKQEIKTIKAKLQK